MATPTSIKSVSMRAEGIHSGMSSRPDDNIPAAIHPHTGRGENINIVTDLVRWTSSHRAGTTSMVQQHFLLGLSTREPPWYNNIFS